jgi:hypothetical protein
MKLTKVKPLYTTDFNRLIENRHGKQFLQDFRNTYYYNKMTDLLFERDIFVRDFSKRNSKLRITFPLFLVIVLLLNIFGCFKWLFTGSARFKEKNWIIKKVIQWDKYCGFNIV